MSPCGSVTWEIGNKYLFMEDTDRHWKIPVLYNDLRRIRGDLGYLNGDVSLETFELALKSVLDIMIPDHYTFSGDGVRFWSWPYDEANVRDEDEDDEDDEDEEDDEDDEDDDDDDDEEIYGPARQRYSSTMSFREFMAERGTAQ
jgi:hypothetical protein